MIKLKKTSELMWVFGVLFVALGVAICSKADLGVSMIAAPAFVISEALVKFSGFFSVGVTEYLFQGLLLVLLCVTVRKFDPRYLLSFAVAVIYGYVLNFFLFILGPVSFDSLAVRWIMLIVGDVFTAFGVASFFRTYLPLQVYELFVRESAKSFKLNINIAKWIFDGALLAVTIVLAFILFDDASNIGLDNILGTSFHSVGLGTLVTTAINSPIIALMGKFLDSIFDPTPLIPKLYSMLKCR